MLAVAKGNKPQQSCGARFNGKKMMIVGGDGTVEAVRMTCPGGGVAVKLTATGIVIATFIKDKQVLDPAGGPIKGFYQNLDTCATQVEAMASYLSEQGY